VTARRLSTRVSAPSGNSSSSIGGFSPKDAGDQARSQPTRRHLP
jgi:hypothetical protein